jgi:glutaredoxin-related protein
MTLLTSNLLRHLRRWVSLLCLNTPHPFSQPLFNFMSLIPNSLNCGFYQKLIIIIFHNHNITINYNTCEHANIESHFKKYVTSANNWLDIIWPKFIGKCQKKKKKTSAHNVHTPQIHMLEFGLSGITTYYIIILLKDFSKY